MNKRLFAPFNLEVIAKCSTVHPQSGHVDGREQETKKMVKLS
jgi:hypothetical protein